MRSHGCLLANFEIKTIDCGLVEAESYPIVSRREEDDAEKKP